MIIIVLSNKKEQRNSIAKLNHPVSLFEKFNHIAYAADPNTYEILYANSFLKKLLGENPIGKKCYKVLHKMDYPCDFCTNEQIMEEKGKPYEWEHYNQVLKKHFLISDQIIEWTDGRDVRFEIAIDITTFKNKDKKLVERIEKSEERFRLAQKAANIGTWDWNIISDELIWADEVTEIFDIDKENFAGSFESFMKFVHPDDKKHVTESVQSCLSKNTDYDIEHRIITSDGSTKWVREKGDVIRDSKEKPIRMIGIVQDITKRKEIEEKMTRLNFNLLHQTAELTAVNKELEAFSYSVSHDLRAPLRSIDGFSQALLEDYENKLDSDGKDYLHRIRNATLKMAELIDSLLKLSRITRRQIKKEKINLSKIANSIVESYDRNNPNRNINITIQNDLYAYGDKQLIQIVLDNLISNAWKFTKKEKTAQIEIGETKKDGKNVFFISDNGVGFNLDYADKLFAPFQRFHTSDEFEGTGIGLGIVSRAINKHGGEILVESKVGEGTIFYFTFQKKIMKAKL